MNIDIKNKLMYELKPVTGVNRLKGILIDKDDSISVMERVIADILETSENKRELDLDSCKRIHHTSIKAITEIKNKLELEISILTESLNEKSLKLSALHDTNVSLAHRLKTTIHNNYVKVTNLHKQLSLCRERKKRSKHIPLTCEQVNIILDLNKKGKTNRYIGRMFKKSHGSIANVIHRITYKHCQEDNNEA